MTTKVKPENNLAKGNISLILINLIILTVIIITQLTLAYNLQKFSRAEIFFAQCAKEMIAQANFITPLFHNHPFFDKPILTYWLIILSFKQFGINHLAARIPSILAALTTNLVLIYFSLKNFDRKITPIIIMVLNTAFMYLSFTVSCMSDMLLTTFDTISVMLLYQFVDTKSAKYLYLTAVSMSWAFLVKGPVGIVLPGISLLIYLFLTNKFKLLKPIHFLLGLIIFLLISMPWFIFVYLKCGLPAIKYFFFHENVTRYLGATYDTHRPIWYMLSSLMLGLAPWSYFIPIALYNFVQNWLKNKPDKFELYIWVYVTTLLLFFTFSHGKIDYYMLPTYPVLAILIGKTMSASSKNNALYGYVFTALLNVICLGFTYITLIIPKFNNSLNLYLIALSVIIFLSNIFLLFQKKLNATYILNGFYLIYLTLVFANYILPNINKFQPAIIYAKDIIKKQQNSPIGIYGSIQNKWFDELTFTTNTEPISLNNETDLKNFINSTQNSYIIGSKDELFKLTQNFKNLRILKIMPTVSHSLNPGFLFKNQGKLTNGQELMLIQKKP